MRKKSWLRKQAYAIIYIRLLEAVDASVTDECVRAGLSEEEAVYITKIVREQAESFYLRSREGED